MKMCNAFSFVFVALILVACGPRRQRQQPPSPRPVIVMGQDAAVVDTGSAADTGIKPPPSCAACRPTDTCVINAGTVTCTPPPPLINDAGANTQDASDAAPDTGMVVIPTTPPIVPPVVVPPVPPIPGIPSVAGVTIELSCAACGTTRVCVPVPNTTAFLCVPPGTPIPPSVLPTVPPTPPVPTPVPTPDAGVEPKPARTAGINIAREIPSTSMEARRQLCMLNADQIREAQAAGPSDPCPPSMPNGCWRREVAATIPVCDSDMRPYGCIQLDRAGAIIGANTCATSSPDAHDNRWVFQRATVSQDPRPVAIAHDLYPSIVPAPPAP